MSQENRQYPRLDFVCPAQCSFIDSFPESFPVGIIDIGPEGFGFLCEEKLELGAKLIIVVNLGTDQPIKFLTTVRWVGPAPNSEKHKIGVKIFDTSQDDLETFIRFYYRGLIPGQVSRKKVLIVYSDKDRAKRIQNALAKFGYDVYCTFNGNDGFAQYISGHPDLILLDLAISKMSALEMCRKIRKLQGDDQVLIFAMLAKEKDKSKIESMDIGIQKYYLPKLSDERLIAVINDTLLGDISAEAN